MLAHSGVQNLRNSSSSSLLDFARAKNAPGECRGGCGGSLPSLWHHTRLLRELSAASMRSAIHVTLSGQVDSSSDRDAAEQMIRKLSGVVGFTNRTTILSP